MNKIAVIGAGAWGQALALQAMRAGRQVILWARTPDRVRGLLPPDIAIAERLPEDRDLALLVLVVPCQFMRSVMAGWKAPAPMVVCAKGVEKETLRLPLEICAETHPGLPGAVLTGPNFAHEVMAGLPAASVVASDDPALRALAIDRLATPTFRLYGSADPMGAQLGGAAKNVLAIAAGAVTGAGLGENARAALITRGMAELSRLVVAMGGKAETVAGLSGIGDLILTCTGAHSRNFSLGLQLGQGGDLSTILAGRREVTEGVATASALVARAGDVELPICRAVAALLRQEATVPELMERLLARPRRDE